MAADKYDVFISYSRADYKDENNVPIPNNVVSKIISAFKKNKISYWIDENGIYTGDNFAPKIAEAIKNASVFVFVSTENSNSSQWTQNEVCVAQSYKKPILPIRCDDSTYAVSVIMYLAMLDYCDYKNSPDTAISQLVESVREKLPVSPTNNEHSQSKDDSIYKENIIYNLSEINHQIVDISQIAVSQILESNDRNFQQLCDITGSGLYHLSESEKKYFESLEESVHFHLDEINNNTKNELREIVSCFHKLTEHIDNFLYEVHEYHKENVERQKMTNDLLKQISSICSELTQRNHFLEKESQTPRILGKIKIDEFKKNHLSPQNVANMFFVIDVSGSMAGDKITKLNSAMRTFIDAFNNNNIIPSNVELRLSVLPYSTDALWQYNEPINIICYKWIDLEASGLTNFGKAISMLNMILLNKEVVSNPQFAPLIVFITDGEPTDSYSKDYSILSSNPVFLSSKCYCISVGTDAHNIIENACEYRVGDTSQLNTVLDHILREYIMSF